MFDDVGALKAASKIACHVSSAMGWSLYCRTLTRLSKVSMTALVVVGEVSWDIEQPLGERQSRRIEDATYIGSGAVDESMWRCFA